MKSFASKKVVIVGGGIGGLSSAFDCKHLLDSTDQVTVISERDHFEFTPSNPWVAVRKRTPKEISLPLSALLKKRNINFIHGSSTGLDPVQKLITLHDGTSVTYDYLIIATGPRLAFSDIPGVGPAESNGSTHSICVTAHAVETAKAVDALRENPGPAVIGATQGASCFGPAYEFALLLQSELLKAGGDALVSQCPITFVTPEPFVGHLGLNGTKLSNGLLTKLFKERNVTAIVNCRIKQANRDSVIIQYHTKPEEDPSFIEEKVLPSKFTMLIPPFRGMECWRKVPNLTDEKGMILVDAHQQSPAYHNIFGVGTCVSMKPIEQTLVPTGAPKTGYMIESMGTAAVNNIKDMILAERSGKEPRAKHRALLSGLCITDFGEEGAIFLTVPQLGPRKLDYTVFGKVGLFAKIAFEKYFLHKIETGDTDPYYEKYMLKLIGVEREVMEA
eukprot:gene27800-33574_t